MAKIKLTKSELKRQRDALKQFNRYLPTLQLKKQQLQTKILEVRKVLEAKLAALYEKDNNTKKWAGLLADSEMDLKPWMTPKDILTDTTNIAGAEVPVYKDVTFETAEYDFYTTPFWVDRGLYELREVVKLITEVEIIKKQIQILEKELRITTQRVNLFEKIKIPECKENIRVIRIYLGDQQANAVGVSKVAKKKVDEKADGARARMIVQMKKIHIIIQERDAKKAFEELQNLGTVHVEHQDPLAGGRVFEVAEGLETLSQVIDILKEVEYDGPKEEYSDWREKANEVLDLKAFIDQYQEYVDKRKVRIEMREPWGNFEPQDIRDLAKKGVFVQFYEIPKATTPEVPDDVVFKLVSSSDGMNRYVAIKRTNENLKYDRVYPPPVSLVNLKKLQMEEISEIKECKELIKENAKYLNQFIALRDEGLDTLALEQTVMGAHKLETLAVLKGFIPTDQTKKMKRCAKKYKWGVLIEEPTEEDQVPTLLRNPKWVELSKPALNMIEILPGYKEVDSSMVFIFFFTLFFAMLIGDAAYGLIFAALTFFVQKKRKDKDKTPYKLMYLLTGATVLWGVLTGTYFGQQWLPAPIKPIFPWLLDDKNVQWLCFTTAVVHLSIARGWTFFLKLPRLTALAEIGWLMIVWGMYFVANMFVLNMSFPPFAGWLFIIGIPLAMLFMFPFNKLFKQLPQEVIPFALGVIGAGVDIISYIRLFAVGLATVAVADAANSMPEALGAVGYGFMVLLHILNMILAAMAILVHAIRLNVLEFSGHLGLEWAGFKYDPLSKRLKSA